MKRAGFFLLLFCLTGAFAAETVPVSGGTAAVQTPHRKKRIKRKVAKKADCACPEDKNKKVAANIQIQSPQSTMSSAVPASDPLCKDACKDVPAPVK